VWDRVVYRLPPDRALARPAVEAEVRALTPDDADAVAGLGDEIAWISKTWGGPAGMAAHGNAVGAFVDGRLASVVCTFFQGIRHEDAGVVTEPEHRGRGLATACASAWCEAVRARGRVPSWTTSPDNLGSLRIPEWLGFELVRRDALHVVGVEVPR
jgi:RimJ/RimL family protein N-acetyltransferase